MNKFIIRRLLQFIPTIIIVSFVIFILLNIVPGDPAFLCGDTRRAMDAKTMEMIREKWGLNDPFYLRYGKYLGNLVKGDLGISFQTNRQVSELLKERIPVTLKLASITMLIAILGGVFLGFISGMKQGSFLDLFCMIGAVTGRSIPSFWLGLMLIYLLSVKLNILPSGGYGGGNILYLILPAFSLGIGYMALIARVTRASVIDVMNEDYIRTARSKGLSEFVIRYKHIFKNALIPVITIIGLQFGGLIAATVVIEKVFSLPGIGSLLIQSIYRRDVALVQGCILLIIFSFLIINFVIDILYAYIDPRIRYQ